MKELNKIFLFMVFFIMGLPKGYSLCPDLEKYNLMTKFEKGRLVIASVLLPPIGLTMGTFVAYQVYQLKKLGKLINETRSGIEGPVTQGLLKSLSKVDHGNSILTADELKQIIMKKNDMDGKEGFCENLKPKPGVYYRSFKYELKELIRLKKLQPDQVQSDALDEED